MTIRDRLRRLLAGAPPSAASPLPDCETCPPAPPLDVVAEQERARDMAYTRGWLIERYPDCWYFESADLKDDRKFEAFAAGILDLRLRVWGGRLTP